MNLQNKLYSVDIPCTVTKICFSEVPDGLFIFAATWDGKLILIKYDEKGQTLLSQREIDITNDPSKPVLAIAELDNKVYVSAEISEKLWGIYQIDLTRNDDFDRERLSLVGKHTKPINQLVVGQDRKLYSFGFDGLCQVWNLDEIRTFPFAEYELGKIVTQVQKKDNYILCVLEGKSFALLDTMDTQSEPVYFSVKSEFLKDAQITSLSINEAQENPRDDLLDFALGTVDGRVIHCEYSLSERPGDKLKGQNPKAGGVVLAHQILHKNQQISFSVNAIAYHKSFSGLLFSGGGEGKVKFHDFSMQKIYNNIFDDLVPVSHILTNLAGDVVIVAKGFGWHPDQNKILGRDKQEKAQVYIYIIDESDLPTEDNC